MPIFSKENFTNLVVFTVGNLKILHYLSHQINLFHPHLDFQDKEVFNWYILKGRLFHGIILNSRESIPRNIMLKNTIPVNIFGWYLVVSGKKLIQKLIKSRKINVKQ